MSGIPGEGRAWVRARLENAPDAVRNRLCEAVPPEGAGPPVEPLCEAALGSLASALDEEGEHRGAFHLLDADAYLTLACQAALLTDEADGALAGILDRIEA